MDGVHRRARSSVDRSAAKEPGASPIARSLRFVRATTMRSRMSTQASSLSPLSPSAGEHARLVRRAKTLSWLSVGWMTVEAGVAIVAALIAGSVALLGFGLDSMIELVSASIIIWRFTGARHSSESAERRAQQLIAACFGALALYLTFDGIKALADGSHVAISWAGAAVAAGAVIIMPLLARAKSRVAAELGSAATAGDAAQSMLCAIAATGVLASVIANAALGWWWLDPVVGLGIAGIAIQEGRKAWAGESCGDCAPVGLGTPAGSTGPTS
jgi:divalent metal cation (Fe/Co/Zn/Cd) transporter